MLKKEDQKILEQFARRVRGLFPDARLWVFGSRARGDAAWDSDFDVCIVLERVDRHTDCLIRDIAWEVGFENERVITTVVIEREDFEHGPMSASTLVANILREGVPA
ncbi:MAG: nucleotidyltransferase domain-containing protein [Deltaproteobacteria bacterium]|nr:nucleotidyltransferase domain-containing protein [Deltaproteobacteria bacterium]MBW1959827.1 nucleotidyltransferase domain-containing protein [Deltaproteobacteria bacterium]MBW1994751.1 nucleotidyltransferase domain-containing protein [Deltaproteobacteria bacterium]MBW2153287.1 nucleotidyltransferase domain-containing protein [Deltaproteobacteria bacterium]